MIIVRIGGAAAMPAIPDVHIVTDLGSGAAADDAVNSDESRVHVRIAVTGRTIISTAVLVNLLPFDFRHDQAIDRLRAVMGAAIHLIKQVGGAERIGGPNNLWINAHMAFQIGGL